MSPEAIALVGTVFAFVLTGLAIRHGLRHGDNKKRERP